MKKETYVNSIYLDGFLIIEPLLLGEWLTYCKSQLHEKNGLDKLKFSYNVLNNLNENIDIKDIVIYVVDNKIDELDGFREGIYFSPKKDEFIKCYKSYKFGDHIIE